MTDYYKISEDGKSLSKVKRVVITDKGTLVLGQAEDFARYQNAYPIAESDSPPAVPEGKITVQDGWELIDNYWYRKWRIEDAPPPAPRRWSRLSIKGALADAHMLPATKAFLSAFEVKPDYTAWEALTDCDYIEDGYGGQEKWNAVLDGAAQALGKTRAEIDAFLDQIPTE